MSVNEDEARGQWLEEFRAKTHMSIIRLKERVSDLEADLRMIDILIDLQKENQELRESFTAITAENDQLHAELNSLRNKE
jgi:DNA polymerase IIIc chi subunit